MKIKKVSHVIELYPASLAKLEERERAEQIRSMCEDVSDLLVQEVEHAIRRNDARTGR